MLDITKFEIEQLEWHNQHGEVAVQLCKSFGTYKEYAEVKAIKEAHEARGHIEYAERVRRDEIISKYYNLAK